MDDATAIWRAAARQHPLVAAVVVVAIMFTAIPVAIVSALSTPDDGRSA